MLGGFGILWSGFRLWGSCCWGRAGLGCMSAQGDMIVQPCGQFYM